MAERDIEKDVSVAYFVDTLRRLADALESKTPFRVQVQNRRFTVPSDAQLIVEHEVEGGQEELALELKWASASTADGS